MSKLIFENEDSLVLLSGGIDSSTLLQEVNKQVNKKVSAIFLDLGQEPAFRQKTYAQRLCHRLNVPLHIIDAPKIVDIYAIATEPPHIMQTETSSRLVEDKGPASSEGITAFVAFTAQWLGYKKLYHGLTTSDENRWPHLSMREISDAVNNLLKVSGCTTEFSFPFIEAGFDNDAVIEHAKNSKFNYEMTWSCLWGNRYHCGECSSCKKRKSVFSKTVGSDPTHYATSAVDVQTDHIPQ
ncbi:7-cyano-7-deazaguanine synthase [Vibrio ziniensis]|uniref:7-cyano-7-deazaguanine synthase n=1 Tax=Vibrio ziniensis TaxID=2711221 RepID=A0A6G7CN84_9VIBR|nr:7-cyano-7-deazaguanine synthase [Vibrio ziniensis]QIH43569.1 hypothetical protein G5S32_16380 [Vibrio ziniensis]